MSCYHPRSGVVIIWLANVCLCVLRQLSKALTYKVHVWSVGIFWGDTGQVCVWKSPGQSQGHSSKNCEITFFSQCKTSLGNNSGSIEDRAVKFACNMGSSMTDHMVWPLSLSRGRKCTHSRVVCLRLEAYQAETHEHVRSKQQQRRRTTRYDANVY